MYGIAGLGPQQNFLYAVPLLPIRWPLDKDLYSFQIVEVGCNVVQLRPHVIEQMLTVSTRVQNRWLRCSENHRRVAAENQPTV